MQIYQSPYKTTNFYADHSIIEEVWNIESEDLSDELYKTEVMQYVHFLNQYKPKNALQNIQNLRFTISPAIQIWINENVMPATQQADNNKLAIVLSEDLFTQVSVEQTLTENPEDYLFETKYFNNSDEAMGWLKS